MPVGVVAVAVAVGVGPLVSVVGKQVGVVAGHVVAVAVAVGVGPLGLIVGEGVGLVARWVVAVTVAVLVFGLSGVVGEGVPEVVDAVLVAVHVKVAEGGFGGEGANRKELAREFWNHIDDVARCSEGLENREIGLVDEGHTTLLCSNDVHVAGFSDEGGLFGMAEGKAGRRPCFGVVVVHGPSGGACQHRGVVNFMKAGDDAVGFGQGGGQRSVAVVDVDVLVVGSDGQAAVVQDFKRGNA